MAPDVKLLIIEDEPSECEAYENYIAQQKHIDLIGCTGSCDEALSLTKELRPNAIILDLLLSEGYGIQFLSDMKKLRLKPEPFVLVVTNVTARAVYKHLLSLGAAHIFPKVSDHFHVKQPIDFILSSRPYLHYGTETISDYSYAPTVDYQTSLQAQKYHNIVSKELDKIGMSNKNAGVRYLIEAICISIIEEPKNMNQQIFKPICEKYQITQKNIEASMSSAIKSAWTKTDIHTLQKNFSAKTSETTGAPTVKTFIFYYSNKLKKH